MSCQPVKGHTVWVLLIAVLADKHVTILERKSVILNSSVQRYKQKDHFFPVFIYFERHLGTKWNQEVSFAIRVIDSEKPQSSARFRHWHLKTKNTPAKPAVARGLCHTFFSRQSSYSRAAYCPKCLPTGLPPQGTSQQPTSGKKSQAWFQAIQPAWAPVWAEEQPGPGGQIQFPEAAARSLYNIKHTAQRNIDFCYTEIQPCLLIGEGHVWQ